MKRVAAVLALVLSSAGADADPRCRAVFGSFDLIPITDATCTSPVGVCGKGTFRGLLRGAYTSQLTSIVPTNDTPSTGVVLITGDTPLNARLGHRSGVINFKDSGAFHTTGDGEFAELFSVVGGTNDFAAVTGTL